MSGFNFYDYREFDRASKSNSFKSILSDIDNKNNQVCFFFHLIFPF